MISFHGAVTVPQNITQHADGIRFENYKTNTPAKFQKHINDCDEDDTAVFVSQLAGIMGIDSTKVDYVYFSVCKGAEPHTDQLDPNRFADITYIIPVILPEGNSTITAEQHSMTVIEGGVYSFDHTKTHSMVLDDMDSGCVVIMATELTGA